MGIDEILSKLKIVDIKAEFKPEGEQVGIVNIKNVETNQTVNYHFYISDPKTAKAFGEGLSGKLSELEARTKDEAIRRLESLGPANELLPKSTQTEVASANMAIAVANEVFGSGNIIVPGPKIQGTGHSVIMCHECGTFVDIESNYCSKCGAKLR